MIPTITVILFLLVKDDHIGNPGDYNKKIFPLIMTMILSLTLKHEHEYYAHHDHAHGIVLIILKYSICYVCL
jgi:hypothetical protein